jgi:hypothetical protein
MPHKGLAFVPLMAAACSTMAADEPEPAVRGETPSYTCRAEGMDRFVGRDGTPETGAEILRASGAKTLRWLRPGMAVTMDFRNDRVNLRIASDNRVQSVSCG